MSGLTEGERRQPAQPAALAKGSERYEGFVEALGRRFAKGQSLADEVSRDTGPVSSVRGG